MKVKQAKTVKEQKSVKIKAKDAAEVQGGKLYEVPVSAVMPENGIKDEFGNAKKDYRSLVSEWFQSAKDVRGSEGSTLGVKPVFLDPKDFVKTSKTEGKKK